MTDDASIPIINPSGRFSTFFTYNVLSAIFSVGIAFSTSIVFPTQPKAIADTSSKMIHLFFIVPPYGKFRKCCATVIAASSAARSPVPR